MLFRTCTKLQNISGIFYGCGLLTGGLDAQLYANNGKITNAQEAFLGCSGLNGEISANLFTFSKNPNITNFYRTFAGCGKLTGSAPPLWSQFSGANGTYCFAGCNKLENYDTIPDQWK